MRIWTYKLEFREKQELVLPFHFRFLSLSVVDWKPRLHLLKEKKAEDVTREVIILPSGGDIKMDKYNYLGTFEVKHILYFTFIRRNRYLEKRL